MKWFSSRCKTLEDVKRGVEQNIWLRSLSN
jgi:hypothetical protein